MLGAGNTCAGDKTTNESSFESTVTHCIGRFLIDLPADAEYVGGSYDYAFASVEAQPMERGAFQEEVESLEAGLTNKKHKSGTSLLLQKEMPGEDTRIFAYWGNENRSSVVEISGYRWLQGIRYLIHKRARNDKVESAVSRMGVTISMLQTREASPPVIQGFCIKHAIFADAGQSDNESLMIRFRLKKHPDIVVDVATNLIAGEPPESLLSRKPGIFSALGILGASLGGMRNIRDGDRVVGGIHGQEWLMKAPNEQGQKAHLFTWETPGLSRDALHPQIRFDLQSGNFDSGFKPGPISMTDKQMLKLWDRILNSLRLRPTDERSQNQVR